MRPDNYLRMVEAYYYNEQKAWLPWRKLYTILTNIGAEEGDYIKETDLFWLHFIDEAEKPRTKPKLAYMPLTKEEILQMKIADGKIKN
ncbi:hypothetical protein [Emticicia fontis]